MKRSIEDYFNSNKKIKEISSSSSSLSPFNSSNSSSSNLIECPFCLKIFPKDFINLHISIHNNIEQQKKEEEEEEEEQEEKEKEEKEENKIKNSFQLLFLNRNLISDLKIFFILNYYEDKLIPQILFLSEYEKIKNNFNYKWKSIIKLKNFDGYIPLIGLEINPLPRKCILYILTNIPSNKYSITQQNRNLEETEISLIKSMIQKAFRRGIVSAGTHLAFQLLIHSPEEFLRRLPIILIEDGVLHWSYPIIVWLMIAVSKGYKPSLTLLLICLHVYIEGTVGKFQDIICSIPHERVGDSKDNNLNINNEDLNLTTTSNSSSNSSLNNDNSHDNINDKKDETFDEEEKNEDGIDEDDNEDEINDMKNINNDLDEENKINENEMNENNILKKKNPFLDLYTTKIIGSITDYELSPQRTLIICLLLRASYGGMEGDMQMLRQICSQWTNRFFLSSKVKTESFEENKKTLIEEIKEKEIKKEENHLYLHENYLNSIKPFLKNTFANNIKSIIFQSLPLIDNIEGYIQQTLVLLSSPLISNQQQDKSFNIEIELELQNLSNQFMLNILKFDCNLHLISEGIDFHCDTNLVPSICRIINTSTNLSQQYSNWLTRFVQNEENLRDNSTSNSYLKSQQDYLKTTIWLFRSSLNVRKTCDWNKIEHHFDFNEESNPQIFTEHEKKCHELIFQKILKDKSKYSGLWRIICPLVNKYCEKKLDYLRTFMLID